MKMELDIARRTQDENRMLQTELSHTWTELRRVDPSRAHIYGSFTQALSSDQSRAGMLPPVQPQPTNGQWGQTSSGAMQGVEYR